MNREKIIEVINKHATKKRIIIGGYNDFIKLEDHNVIVHPQQLNLYDYLNRKHGKEQIVAWLMEVFEKWLYEEPIVYGNKMQKVKFVFQFFDYTYTPEIVTYILI